MFSDQKSHKKKESDNEAFFRLCGLSDGDKLDLMKFVRENHDDSDTIRMKIQKTKINTQILARAEEEEGKVRSDSEQTKKDEGGKVF